MGWSYRCPDCGCYYDFYCPFEYGCRYCRGFGPEFADEYFPREVEYHVPRYGYRKPRHYARREIPEPEWELVDKESKKRILKAELEDIEKEMAEIKEELEVLA